MANKDDYLTEYRQFFENFAHTVNPNDQLPVKLASYKLVNLEVVGGIIDWTTQYLTQKNCPQCLIAPIIKIVIDEIRKACKKHPIACGFNPSDNAYEPLKLMQTVMAKTNEVCLRYLDNSMLCSLPLPGHPHNIVSVCAVKNTRRRMEDRHVVIHDLNTMFNKQEASPSSYYAIFDGHAGHDAAAYSAAHLHQFLAESEYFISDPEKALQDAFYKTDALFIEKCKVEHFSSGTTAVCALHKPKEKCLYIAWVGDSQALLVKQGKVLQCVQPHKPCREDEKNRIEQEGGAVIFWGTWRVNGQLAVSRAIGDSEYKPYVIAVPDVREIQLDGDEDFLIIACDGLWDFLSEDDAARCVYNLISTNPDDTDYVSQRLVQLSKQKGSSDNISVIVVFLREPSKIAAEAHWANRNGSTMDASLDNANATNNPFVNSNGSEILSQKENFLLNLNDSFNKQNGTDLSPTNDLFSDRTNGKRLASEFDDDDDLGPETDVDIVDDVLPETNSDLNETKDEKNPFYDDVQEKASIETNLDDDKSPRETPTPPADAVHDVSGVVENIAESGDDSEEEWDYYKGDSAQKGPDNEVADIIGDDTDTMSQLNPNAAEFVPISPTRGVESPAHINLLNDTVISQSPRRVTPHEVDIKLPDAKEFDNEVKSKPAELEQFSIDHNNENGHNLSSKEIMNNFLNGKNIDEIDFQPLNATPNKLAGDEFHFGPNATPFTTPGKILDQSEALSTKAVYGDDSVENVTQSFVSFSESNSSSTVKDELLNCTKQDLMSTSVYEKNESVDLLNTVQVLPDNIDEFLNKPNATCDNNLFVEVPQQNLVDVSVVKTTDLDEGVELDIDKKDDFCDTPQQFGVDLLNESSPVLDDSCNNTHLVPNDLCQRPQSQSPMIESLSPQPEDVTGKSTPENLSVSPVPNVSHSPEMVYERPESKSPAMDVLSDNVDDDNHDLCRFDSEPIESPIDDITSSVKDEVSPTKEILLDENIVEGERTNLAQEILNPIEESIPVEDAHVSDEFHSEHFRENLISDSCQVTSPISIADTESVATTDVNSFLNRSDFEVSLVASPLNSSNEVFNETDVIKDSPVYGDSQPRVLEINEPINESREAVGVEVAQNQIREKLEIDVEKVSEPAPKMVEQEEAKEVADALSNFVDLNSKTDVVETSESVKSGELENRIHSPVYEDSQPRVLEINEPVNESQKGGGDIEVVQDQNREKREVEVEEVSEPTPKPVEQEENKEVANALNAGVALGAVAAAATAAAVTAATTTSVSSDKKVTKAKPSTTTSKKPVPPKSSPTKPKTTKPPTKTTSSATTAKTTSLSSTRTSTISKTSAPNLKPVASKTITKTTTTSTATSKTSAAEKKPLTNGEVKTARSMVTAKKSTEASSPKASPVGKASPTKPLAARPATAPLKTTTTANQALKPKPTTLSPRTASTRTSTVTSSKSTAATTTMKPSTITSMTRTSSAPATKPRPATTTTARVPLTKTITKGPATEKQIKETVNKQITASPTTRNITSRTTTTKRPETKTVMGTTRTTTTRTSVTSLKSSGAKKSTETTVTKTKTNARKPQENGVSMIDTITTVVTTNNTNSIEPHLQKDNSPVDNIIDNSQIIQSNAD